MTIMTPPPTKTLSCDEYDIPTLLEIEEESQVSVMAKMAGYLLYIKEMVFCF